MPPLVQLLIGAMPDIIEEIRRRHAAANPAAPQPTAEEIIAAFEEAFTSSIAKDRIIRAALG